MPLAYLTRFKAYAVVVLTTGVVLGLLLLLQPLLPSPLPFAPFFIPIVLAALIGGLGAGWCALVLSILGYTFFIAEPHYSLAVMDAGEWTRALLYAVAGSVVLWLTQIFRRLERQAAESRHWLATLVESSGDAIVGKTLQGVITSWNPAAERLFGYQAAEIIGQPITRLIPPERHSEEDAILAQLRRGQRVAHYETERIRKDGQRIQVALTISPIKNETGAIIGASKIARDITAQKQAEEAQRQRNERLELLSAAAARLLTTDRIDLAARPLLEQVTQRFGLSACFCFAAGEKTSAADGWLKISVAVADDSDWLAFEQRLSDALAEERCPRIITAEGQTGDWPAALRALGIRACAAYPLLVGERFLGALAFFSQQRATFTLDELELFATLGYYLAMAGERLRLLAELQDRAARLAESEERFRIAQELSLDAFTLLDAVRDARGRLLDFRWRYVNPAAAQLLQRPREALVGARLLEVLPGNKTASELFERYVQVVETGEPHDLEIRYEADGIHGWFRNMAVKLNDGVAVYFSDITARKAAEEALKTANRHKDEFLATLAHELRNPLAPIRTAAQLLRLKQPYDPDLQRARDIIDRQVQHLTRLVDDLLDISRVNRDKITLQSQPLELAAVVARAVEASAPLMEARKHRLIITSPPPGLRLEGDEVRLVQVLTNLLDNAAKYSPDGARVWLTAERQGQQVVIRVKDEGVGIPPELLPHIFDLFVQGKQGLDRPQGGLGIGLALVKRLVEMHGGRIQARVNDPGRGSEFLVWLPLLAAVEPSPVEEPRIVSTNPASRRILVVDDNADAAESLAMLLELAGHDVQVAYDGPAALAALSDRRPDVILLDIGLPGMDGYAVAREVRARYGPRSPMLIAMTGYGQPEDRARAQEAGFDFHLVKPVAPDTLMALLASAQAG